MVACRSGRAPDEVPTSEEADALRDAVYASLHEGSAWQWATVAA